MKNLLLVPSLVFFCSVCGVSALSLDEAKSSGLVGETQNGYVEVVNSIVPAEAWAVVRQENAKRQRLYRQTAAKEDSTVNYIESEAGKKAIAETKSGFFIKSYGAWKKK